MPRVLAATVVPASVYYVGGNEPAPGSAQWTAILVGHLGGTWELILADENETIRFQEMSPVGVNSPRPRDTWLEALGVEFLPGGRWEEEGPRRFTRPVRPWQRREPAEPGAGPAESLTTS